MTSTALRELEARVRGPVLFDQPLASHTTYRIGGPAAALVTPRSSEDVVEALRFARETGARWLVLGLGSNVLVSDEGFDGVVIRLGKGLDTVSRAVGGEKHVWTVGAGLPMPRLARLTANAGLAGVHRLIGVPGALGGGVFMNAGAHGQDLSQVVRAVDLVDESGTVSTRSGSEVQWRYRASGLNGSIVVGATLVLEPGDPSQLKKEIRQHFRWRKAGTPFTEPCCGSVFRNPTPPAPVDSGPRTAGQFIDACRLKGFRIGGARVSSKHANYIVNTGSATASDVKAVIDTVRERVLKEFGVELQLEVKII